MTFVCVVLEMFALLINLSLYGSVNSHMLLSAVFLVLVYRAAFDFRIGASAFAILFFGQWAVVIAEVSGLIPAQSGIVGRPDQIYLTAQRELTGALFTSGILVLAFWAINWMVLRLRYKERAIRMLRATLAAAEPGKVGRYTGRTLQDTYRVGALLGTGGMGEVYRGSHRRSRRPVAIKLLHPHLIDDPVLLARFRREAEIVGSVGSDHNVSGAGGWPRPGGRFDRGHLRAGCGALLRPDGPTAVRCQLRARPAAPDLRRGTAVTRDRTQ